MATTIDVSFFNSFYIKSSDANDNWHIEESRIKGDFNAVQVDIGVRAYIIDEDFTEERRKNALIYSGVFNSRTGINNTNQFSPAEAITKSVNSANGSIQKLFAEETNLIILQEDKVSRALINKDAIFSAEGGGTVTSSKLVIGQIIPFVGKYGISKNPESFASFGNRKYFADKNRGLILRLSSGQGGGDGLTPISEYGMRSFFRDNLKDSSKVVGMFDNYHKSFIVSLQKDNGSYETVSFSDAINGWTSRHDYKPSQGFSLSNKFYTFNNSDIWNHYDRSAVDYGRYYGTSVVPSTVTFVVNSNAVQENVFYSISYEGTSLWELNDIKTNTDDRVLSGTEEFLDKANNVANSETSTVIGYIGASIFTKRNNRYYAELQNSSPIVSGEIYDVDNNLDVTGIKGNFVKATFSTTSNNKKQELFSTNTVFNNVLI